MNFLHEHLEYLRDKRGRSRVRDYYDLWSILKHYRNLLNLPILPRLVLQKCAVKEVHFSGPADLFTPELTDNIQKDWTKWLKPFVSSLPDQNIVLQELREELETIWAQAVIPSESIISNLER